jgi:hypothetical protein
VEIKELDLEEGLIEEGIREGEGINREKGIIEWREIQGWITGEKLWQKL